MYLEKRKINGVDHFFIMESYTEGGRLKRRTLYELGPEPEKFIVYPGGNSFYVHESIELGILEKGYSVDTFELEALMWEFVNPRLRMVLKQPDKKKTHGYMSRAKLREAQAGLHEFDKRRIHFLRFGVIDQSDIEKRPYRFFNVLIGKSRDEIECMIDERERKLKKNQLKTYVYTIFNLQKYFKDRETALKNPVFLNQEKLEDAFLNELCSLNRDEGFIGEKRTTLHPYLVKYFIMFYENRFPTYQTQGHAHQRREKFFYMPRETSSDMSIRKACALLGLSVEEYNRMTKKELSRRFKRLAHKCHPDKGGTNGEFVELCKAYESLLKAKS
ncbi:MAG: hypothetical protein D6710_07700 [Nitrospirae bacterium]|nr:MAG: hypothetical protein D6710_07700 [Nitrospirota bacterium]